MAKSRLRGGAKAHRKRIQKRNQELGIQNKKIQKVFTEMYESKMNELKSHFEKMSADTENVVTDENNELQIGETELSYEDKNGENQTTNTESKGE